MEIKKLEYYKSEDYKMKNNYYLIVILVVVVIGILACVLTQNVGTTETIGNTENTFATTNTNTNTNTNTQNVTNTTEENENTTSDNNTTNVESQNVTEVVEQPVTNNQIYESDSDIGTTDKKQEAINLVKDVWGEDNTVMYRFDNITSDGKYIIAVVSLKTASVKNYFKVDLNTKQVEVDY